MGLVTRALLIALSSLGIVAVSCQRAKRAEDDSHGSTTVNAASHDSSAFAYPWSYYVPIDDVEVGDYQLSSLALRPPDVRLTTGGPDENVRYTCDQPLVRADTVDLSCPTTPIGAIHIRGSFTNLIREVGTRDLQKEAVLNATVTVQSGARPVFSKRVRFGYWEGE